MRKLTLVAAAAAVLTVHLSANAASSASASVENLTLSLFDLNPKDGIAPSISFATGSFDGLGSLATTSASDAAIGSQSGRSWSVAAFGPAASTSTAGGAAASASLTGSVLAGSMNLMTTGSAAGAKTPGFSTSFNASAQSAGEFDSLDFTLSPYTLVVFSGTANLYARTTVGIDADFNDEMANASATLSIRGPGAAGQDNQTSTSNYTLGASWGYAYDPDTGEYHYSGEIASLANAGLVGSYLNYTTGSLNGTLSVGVGVSGSSSVSAVPEPQSAALLFAGLATVGSLVRRRRMTL